MLRYKKIQVGLKYLMCTRLPQMKTGMRATQLADAMDPLTFKEALHRTTMLFEYVHRAESRRLEREERARFVSRRNSF